MATFDPGDAGYTTFPVTNVWGIAPDSRRHQNSLNSRQALRNPDGTITVVLANWDPGVANWIDAAGLREGIIMLRWQLPGQETHANGATVKAKLVKRDALKAALPEDIALVTPAARAALVTKHAADFERRFNDRFP